MEQPRVREIFTGDWGNYYQCSANQISWLMNNSLHSYRKGEGEIQKTILNIAKTNNATIFLNSA